MFDSAHRMEDVNSINKCNTVKPVCLSNPAKAVAQDRWSLITGCTQNHIGIIMNVYTYVCIIYIGRQANVVLV